MTKRKPSEPASPDENDVLRRMLATPPKPHVPKPKRQPKQPAK